MPKQFSQPPLYPQGQEVYPCLPSILTEYPVHLGVLKPPKLRVNICGKFYTLCQSFIHVLIGNKKCPLLNLLIDRHIVLCYLMNWGGEIRCLRQRGREGVKAILNELRRTNFPELLMPSIRGRGNIFGSIHVYVCVYKSVCLRSAF